MEESAQPYVPPRSVGVARQVAASIVVALMTMNAGMAQGWMSPMSLVLTSDDSPVGKCSEQDIMNLASVPTLMVLVLAFVVGGCANKIGRKKTLIGLGVAGILSGIILMFPISILGLYIGRVLAAFPIMSILMSLMYVTETVQVPFRGLLASTCTVSLNVGILIAYILGTKLSYVAFNFSLVLVPEIFTVLMFWMPESPCYFIEKSRIEDAKKSLKWLRGNDEEVVEREMEILLSTKPEEEESVSFTQILKVKQFRRAFIISLLSYSLQMLSGIAAILNYSGLIFEATGSPFSAEDSSIFVAFLMVVASVGNSILIDKLGRKPLLYLSFVGGALGMGVLAAFLYSGTKGANLSEYEWVSLATIGTFVIVYGAGLASIPGVLMNEVSPTNIRATVGVAAMIFVVAISNCSLQSFSFLKDNVGLYSVFAIPAIFNFLGIIFTRCMVLETKGKSLEMIADELKR